MKSITEKILELKAKRNAIILVHNYQLPEVQDIADFLGDSLDLSRKASQTNADVIVFCGVHFMAETASILCPEKTVLLPEIKAGCPMADMIDVKKLNELKRKHPDAVVVCYINTSAEIKAESDICCASSNAVNVVNSIKDKEIIFIPDQNLGKYIEKLTGKKMIFFGGYCPIHIKISAKDILGSKKKYPNAEVLAHPECTEDVLNLADKILSTNGMVRYAKESASKEMIIATEQGIIYRLKKENPEKNFYPATEKALCKNMKKISLEKILWALEDMKYEIKVPPALQAKAIKSIEKMLKY
ncbi:MAG: quinolinate synthase NadA [Elusimicrobia bacterium]|nr:quinolinate synthase NadA [Elusimicrobiota bacterium]